jgi:hypothetical protein
MVLSSCLCLRQIKECRFIHCKPVCNRYNTVTNVSLVTYWHFLAIVIPPWLFSPFRQPHFVHLPGSVSDPRHHIAVKFYCQVVNRRPPLWSSGQSSWLQIQRSRVWFPALPDFLRSSGSGTGSTQPREDNWGATWKDSSGSGLENRG